eukprot:TRINITY_DN13841_c0_g1_i1.p1 TRINITY_DN13841_c0_g1~~TRINITY_DN13841_c0_g1_i1.p1  ORF type:complete len:190 (-),score=28.65 TRINITY_DN13841_c0_g1_i1:25-594(-)
MCIRDRYQRRVHGENTNFLTKLTQPKHEGWNSILLERPDMKPGADCKMPPKRTVSVKELRKMAEEELNRAEHPQYRKRPSINLPPLARVHSNLAISEVMSNFEETDQILPKEKGAHGNQRLLPLIGKPNPVIVPRQGDTTLSTLKEERAKNSKEFLHNGGRFCLGNVEERPALFPRISVRNATQGLRSP